MLGIIISISQWLFFFFNDTATTEIYTLSLHDALPISAHEQRYGYRMEDESVELVNLRLVATVPVEKPELAEPSAGGEPEAGRREANFDGEWRGGSGVDPGRRGGGSGGGGPPLRGVKEATCVGRPRQIGRGHG